MINHRGPEFAAMLSRILDGMRPFFGTSGDIAILSCAGTGGLEAAVVNTLSPGDRVIGVSIGAFGDRFAKIAQAYGADVTKLDVEWGRAADPDGVASALRSMAADGRPARAILLTHNETSTGVENPLAELAAVTREVSPQTLILVDAISGLGAVPFETDGWGLDVVATGSQKSWMSPPGLAMVSVGARAWRAAERATMPRFYFDLAKAKKSLATGETPWTPAVGILFAMDVALDMLETEGYAQIFKRHEACSAAARSGLQELGYPLFADPKHASKTVTSASLPEGVEWSALNREMRARGLVVAGGQDWLAGKILRIGHLGEVDVDDVVDAIAVVGEASNAIGFRVDVQAAVHAARGAAESARTPAPPPGMAEPVATGA
jgi:aspartate aminotransferase-like enzyme